MRRKPMAPGKGTLIRPSPHSRKTLYQTPSHFEQIIRYYRAVRHGSHIFVSGTTAIDPASPVSAPPQILHPGDAATQARVAFEECLAAVAALGGDRGSVVRVRMYVSRREDCAAVGRVFREMFGRREDAGEKKSPGVGVDEVGAAATMIVVRDGFVDRDMLVEVEVDAIVDE